MIFQLSLLILLFDYFSFVYKLFFIKEIQELFEDVFLLLGHNRTLVARAVVARGGQGGPGPPNFLTANVFCY